MGTGALQLGDVGVSLNRPMGTVRRDGVVHHVDKAHHGQDMLVRFRRFRLRREDGTLYLNRWGMEIPGVGGVLLHRMDAPDPDIALHDHPWSFVSIILAGGYTEERALTRDAARFALAAEKYEVGDHLQRGEIVERRRWSVRRLGLEECHRITHLAGKVSWSLVIHGPRRWPWGFWTAKGWVHYRQHERPLAPEGNPERR